MFNGTGANVVSLRAVARPYDAVICAATAHLNIDECGAPERVGGFKLLPVDTPGRQAHARAGGAAPDPLRRRARGPAARRVDHAVDRARHGLHAGRDRGAGRAGARAAGCCCTSTARGSRTPPRRSAARWPRSRPTRAPTSLSFGATKNGALGAEAVVLLRADLGDGVQFMRKQSMQLASKMRFVSAQLDALLADDRWRAPAEHANAMARRLADARGRHRRRAPDPARRRPTRCSPCCRPGSPSELQRDWRFYIWDEATGEVRWMCSWDTRAGGRRRVRRGRARRGGGAPA